MMVGSDDVDKIARLARLQFGEDEVELLVAEMAQIVEHMQKLNELETDDVPPTYHVLDLKNVFRDDEVKASLSPDEVLSNAPKRNGDYFSVPKVIG